MHSESQAVGSGCLLSRYKVVWCRHTVDIHIATNNTAVYMPRPVMLLARPQVPITHRKVSRICRPHYGFAEQRHLVTSSCSQAIWIKLRIMTASPVIWTRWSVIPPALGAAQVAYVPQGSQYIADNTHRSTTHNAHHNG